MSLTSHLEEKPELRLKLPNGKQPRCSKALTCGPLGFHTIYEIPRTKNRNCRNRDRARGFGIVGEPLNTGGAPGTESNKKTYRRNASMQLEMRNSLRCAIEVGALLLAALPGAAQAAWKPTRNIEFIVPAGTGGGADQMARMIQGVIEKNKLLDKSVVVINKSGGAGAEGFLDVKGSAGDPHKIIITLSNLFTTPLATGVFTGKISPRSQCWRSTSSCFG